MTQRAVIRQIDHLLCQTNAPEPLFSFLTGELGLPIAWPLRSYGNFASGGVHAGTANIEVTRLDAASAEPSAATAELRGLAFEPTPLSESLAELERRGIRHGPPERPHPSEGELQRWTNVALDGLLPGAYVFLCEYAYDVAGYRELLNHELSGAGGGPLGIVGVKEVDIGVADFASSRQRWEALLSPARSIGEAHWAVGKGPSLRLTRAEADGMRSFSFAVGSLPQAKDALERRGLIVDGTLPELRLSPERVQHLDIRIVEQ